MALVAERLFTEPELLEDVRGEFDAAVAERPYSRPIAAIAARQTWSTAKGGDAHLGLIAAAWLGS